MYPTLFNYYLAILSQKDRSRIVGFFSVNAAAGILLLMKGFGQTVMFERHYQPYFFSDRYIIILAFLSPYAGPLIAA